MTYEVQVARSVLRVLRRLDLPLRARLWARIRALENDPRPHGVKTLTGARKGHYRLRVSDYRVVYTIRDAELLVLVVRVGPRRTIYEDLERGR